MKFAITNFSFSLHFFQEFKRYNDVKGELKLEKYYSLLQTINSLLHN